MHHLCYHQCIHPNLVDESPPSSAHLAHGGGQAVQPPSQQEEEHGGGTATPEADSQPQCLHLSPVCGMTMPSEVIVEEIKKHLGMETAATASLG